MVVIDYNEIKGTFTLLNSYGEGWQNGGFIDLSFAKYMEYAQEACTLDLGFISKRNECPFILEPEK